ncbi:CLUMA_CG011513, isoform A [Clunio marinus]|uniref:CLUMA_CG011513, isoform A n=1 Tax=Clunio marinus TaxID=568069 RepID=A0A1J1II67_9DIPT|nr:CLUMA_CG011513, isoform A [Clunio marinus]
MDKQFQVLSANLKKTIENSISDGLKSIETRIDNALSQKLDVIRAEMNKNIILKDFYLNAGKRKSAFDELQKKCANDLFDILLLQEPALHKVVNELFHDEHQSSNDEIQGAKQDGCTGQYTPYSDDDDELSYKN